MSSFLHAFVQNEVHREAALPTLKVPQEPSNSRPVICSTISEDQATCDLFQAQEGPSSVISSSTPPFQGSSLARPCSGSSNHATSLMAMAEPRASPTTIITMAEAELSEAIPTSIIVNGTRGCVLIAADHSQAQVSLKALLVTSTSGACLIQDMSVCALVVFQDFECVNNIIMSKNYNNLVVYSNAAVFSSDEMLELGAEAARKQNNEETNDYRLRRNEVIVFLAVSEESIPDRLRLKLVTIPSYPVQGNRGPPISFNYFKNSLDVVDGGGGGVSGVLLTASASYLYASKSYINRSSNMKTNHSSVKRLLIPPIRSFSTKNNIINFAGRYVKFYHLFAKNDFVSVTMLKQGCLYSLYKSTGVLNEQTTEDDEDATRLKLVNELLLSDISHKNGLKIDNDFVNLNKYIPSKSQTDVDCNRSNILTNRSNYVKYENTHGSKMVSWVSRVTRVEDGPATNARWGIPRGLGLRGGGESSLNTGTSGWGTPPAGGNAGWGANPPGPPQGQWGANRPPGQAGSGTNQPGSDFNNQGKQQTPNQQGQSQASNQNNSQQSQQQSNSNTQQPTSQGQNPPGQSQPNTSWAQAAGKNLPQSNQNQSSTPSNTTKQLEQLNSMREALFSQDGWGGQHVNQDTSWDIPGSPEPGVKAEAAAAGAPATAASANAASALPMWNKQSSINNGTELWEQNLRNGGQPPPQPQSKTPWGPNPIKNHGGTWGEPDDETSDSPNVWNGVPQNNQNTTNPWPGNNPSNWPGGPEKTEWGQPGGAGGNTGANWTDPRPGLDPRGVGGIDPRDINLPGMPDLRDSLMRNVRTGDSGVMRGDLRGVSGRLNGAPEMWAAHQQQQQNQQQQQQPQPPNKLTSAPPGASWPGPMPKDMAVPGNVPKTSGWEEPSPPSQRRNITNYDDGTSLWSQQHGGRGAIQPGAGGNMGRGGMPCPPGMPQNRMPNSANMKPDNQLWGGPLSTRNNGWDTHDVPPAAVGAGWGDTDQKGPGNWNNEPPLTPPSWPGGPKPTKAPGWEENVDAPWGHPMQRQVPKPLTKELIWASKPFRILTEMNFKKEDIENALRTTNMSLQDALEILYASRGDWNRRQDDHPFDPTGAPFGRFNPGQQMPFPPGGPGNHPNNPTAGLLNNPSLTALQSMKLLTQQPTPPQQPAAQLGQQQQRPGAAQPSSQQLKMLVQQIQMAVQAGYLNHQILNQPLAPQTLLLLNQLLQQIKLLHSLNQQHNLLQLGGQLSKNSSTALQLSVQITKTKQTITNYQNQIASQQANYVKQQQHLLPQTDPSSDLFKPNLTDPLSAMQANFSDLNINKEPNTPTFQSQQQSRLVQWKLPSLDKDGENDFSRAPGPTSKSILSQSHSSPNINPLLGQSDATWSSRTNSDTGWPDSSTNEITSDSNKESQWANSQPQSNTFADVIPEFEPGKPWKGTMKNIEDDPSITPGSVARSPLCLSSIKDTEIFSSNSKSSPPATSSIDTITSLSLSSSTWSFNAPSSSSFTSPLGKLNSSKSTWADPPPPSATTSELWGVSSANKARGPPPGLPSKMQPPTSWSGSTSAGSRASWGAAPSGWGSPWLLLRNLTPQIDGSTLKTLCLQHGPLHNFHLYLNHGIALAKYSSREEANKAQTALNNCVLGNTTIFAESPPETEVVTMLSSLGHAQPQPAPQTGSQTWNLRGQTQPNKQGSSNDTWATGAGSNLWQPNPSGSSLWGTDGESHRTTPSASLNSFLPPDLLNGESM